MIGRVAEYVYVTGAPLSFLISHDGKISNFDGTTGGSSVSELEVPPT